MPLRFKEKQSLYHHLGQLLRSGVTFPAALQTLNRNSRGNLRHLLTSLNRSVAEGKTVSEAFEAQRSSISELEVSVVASVEQSGKLDRGLADLSEYFAALEKTRADVWKRLAYPLFILHFAVLLFSVVKLVLAGWQTALWQAGLSLGLFWGVVLVIYLLAKMLGSAAATSPAIDGLLRAIPMIGAVRRHFATSRFCATYEVQLGAGVNIMDALTAAGRASQSALMRQAVDGALPEVRGGTKPGALLAMSGAFPEDVTQAISVGEQTGQLDEELRGLAATHRAAAVEKLGFLATWGPMALYLGVAGYIGYRIIMAYYGYLQQVMDITNQIN